MKEQTHEVTVTVVAASGRKYSSSEQLSLDEAHELRDMIYDVLRGRSGGYIRTDGYCLPLQNIEAVKFTIDAINY